MMQQLALFHLKNGVATTMAIQGPATLSALACRLRKSETTIIRALKGDIGVSENTKALIKKEADKVGYVLKNKYKKINPDFLTGKKNEFGIPEVREDLIIQARKDRMDIRTISKITGISETRIRNILTKNGLPTHNLRTKIENGMSERQRIAVESVNKKIKINQIFIKNSEHRKNISRVLVEYKKNNTPIERICADMDLNKSCVWPYLRRSFTYNILNTKRRALRPFAGQKDRYEEKMKSRKYRFEKQMTDDVFKYLTHTYSGCVIEKEKLISKTSFMGRGGYCCDFFIKEKNLCVEVKQRTTSSSNKSLYGQIFVYKSRGYSCAVVFPDDTFIPHELRQTLTANLVTIHQLPCQ